MIEPDTVEAPDALPSVVPLPEVLPDALDRASTAPPATAMTCASARAVETVTKTCDGRRMAVRSPDCPTLPAAWPMAGRTDATRPEAVEDVATVWDGRKVTVGSVIEAPDCPCVDPLTLKTCGPLISDAEPLTRLSTAEVPATRMMAEGSPDVSDSV